MNRQIVYTLLSALLLCTSSLMGQGLDSLSREVLWERAGEAYVAKDYNAAIVDYRAILDGGVSSAELLYNVGNAHYKRGELARSILYYNKALRLAPTDADIIHNLRVAEEHTRDHIEELPEFILTFWHRRMYSNMSSNQWAILSLATLVMGCCFMLLFMLSRSVLRRKIGFFGMLVMVVIFASTTSYAVEQRDIFFDESQAIVMVKSLTVKSSPEAAATDLFILHEGTKVELGKSMGEWVEVTIADGKRGWINRKMIEVI